ncbi:hypothetical protein QBC35DRAFT_209234, partial [Podospora australis]
SDENSEDICHEELADKIQDLGTQFVVIDPDGEILSVHKRPRITPTLAKSLPRLTSTLGLHSPQERVVILLGTASIYLIQVLPTNLYSWVSFTGVTSVCLRPRIQRRVAQMVLSGTAAESEWLRPINSSVSPVSRLDATTRIASFNTYTDYVDYLVNVSQYTYLRFVSAFFKSIPPIPSPAATTTTTLVADLQDSNWRFTTEVSIQTLSRTQDVKARVVIIECTKNFAFVNRNTLDLVAHFYDLNPFDLWFALERFLVSRYFKENQDLCPSFPAFPLATPRPDMPIMIWNGVPYASDREVDGVAGFLVTLSSKSGSSPKFPTAIILSQFGTPSPSPGAPSHTSATEIFRVMRPNEKALACTLLDQQALSLYQLDPTSPPPPPLRHVPARPSRLDLFTNLISIIPDPVTTVTSHPAELLLPFLHLTVRRISAEVDIVQSQVYTSNLANMYSLDDLNEPDKMVPLDFRIHSQVLNIDICLFRCAPIFRQFASLHSLADSPRARAIIDEMTLLAESMEKLKSETEKFVQRRVALLALAESRKSIQLSDSVALLTKLAFVFIPLTFSASLFGMNIDELGSGGLPIWVFVLTAMVVSGFTGVVWWAARHGDTVWKKVLSEELLGRSSKRQRANAAPKSADIALDEYRR